jgi:cytidylate kinase
MNSIKNSDRVSNPGSTTIAIDGYSSCGKSTFAQRIARELGFVYIDSGAMYRAVALYGLENEFISSEFLNQEILVSSLDHIHVGFNLHENSRTQETLLNGRNVETEIRGIEVSSVVSRISQIHEVREKMVKLQRFVGQNGRVVMDGRDIGTVVFPNARLKIFMTADPIVRAQRRYEELIRKGLEVKLHEITENLRMRDHEDENRVVSPLRKAEDALILDNSHMTVEQQMDWFREQWNARKEHD